MTARAPSLWMLHDMECHVVVTTKKPGRIIANCDCRYNSDEDNAAHARMAMAAPDLLAALRALRDAVDVAAGNLSIESISIPDGITDLGDYAIARATKEENNP